MKRLLLVVFYLCFYSVAQGQNFKWISGFGSQDNEFVFSSAADLSGNSYVIGRFFQTIKFNPALNIPDVVYSGVVSSFLVKYDTNGQLVWAKKLGESSDEYALVFSRAIVYDKKGFIYVTGSFQATVDFDLGPSKVELTSYDTGNSFLAKYDLDGKLIWVKAFGGGHSKVANVNASPTGQALSIDKDYNIYVAGNYVEEANINPNDKSDVLKLRGKSDAFVAKFSENGDYVWSKGFGGSDLDFAHSLAINGNNLYIGGIFKGTANFDPDSDTKEFSSNGENDFYISKFDLDGNYYWTNTFGDTEYDYVKSLQADNADNLYITGAFNGTIDFDPSSDILNLESNGASDIFLAKFNSEGNLLWAQSFGSKDYDSGTSLVLDTEGNPIITGGFLSSVVLGSADSEKTLTSKGSVDMFVAKFNKEGILQWAEAMGGTGPDYGESIATDNKDNFYLSGRFASAVTLKTGNTNSTLTAKGLNDAFVLKFSSSTVTGLNNNLEYPKFSAYPNPAKDHLAITTNQTFAQTKIELLNLKGQVLYSSTYFNTKSIFLNLDKIPGGLYLIKLETPNFISTSKLIIE